MRSKTADRGNYKETWVEIEWAPIIALGILVVGVMAACLGTCYGFFYILQHFGVI